jgi:hypothetical protein
MVDSMMSLSGPMPGCRGEIARHALAWAGRAHELAAWTLGHLVHRQDAYGHYLEAVRRKDADLKTYTDKSELTLATIERHYRGASTGDLIGLHSTATNNTSRWAALDIDRHGDEGDPEANLKAALVLHERAKALGFKPLLLDSNGRGGYHLVILFDGPAPTEKVYRFLRWLSRDWWALGLAKAPETFPKQPGIKAGGYGNWLRLPGRHHTHDHFSKIYRDGEWLEGWEAVDEIVSAVGSPAALIPVEALAEPGRKAKPKRCRPHHEHDRDVALARSALDRLAALADDYDTWIEIGQALTQLGDDGLALWDEWSSLSSKYNEGDCERKWRTFTRDDGRALGTVFHHAKRAGWTAPNGNGRAHHEAQGGQAESDGHAGAEAEHEPDAPEGDDESAFENLADGRPLRVAEIDERLRGIAGEWPKRVGDTLFCESPDRQPFYLDSPARLLAWIDERACVRWGRGVGYITQERYYEHLRMTAPAFDAIETIPHFPPLPGTYYMHRALPRPAGKLR